MSRFQIPSPLRLLLGVALVAVVLVWYDAGSAVRALGGTRWWLAAPAIACLTLVHVLPAATWKMLTRQLAGARLAWKPAIRAYYAAQALGTLTPASIGSDAYRVRAVHSGAIGWKRAVLPVVVHRATSYLSLALLASVAALLIPMSTTARAALIVIPLIALAGGAIYLSKRPLGSRQEAGDDSSHWSAAASALILSAAFHAAAVVVTYVLVLAVDPHVNPVTTLAALMLARVASFLPFTPAGLGLQEGAFVLLLPQGGITPEAAVAVSALTRVAMLVTLAAGAVALSAAGKAGPGSPVERDPYPTPNAAR